MVTYIRQLGKERTGTNYVKALLAQNFENINLFDDRLGSKHDVFKDVDAWMLEHKIESEKDIQRLIDQDEFWARRNGKEKFAHGINELYEPINYDELKGLRDKKIPLNFIINIKNPYSYAISINRWITRKLKGFVVPPGYFEIDLAVVAEQCKIYNEVYRSLLPLLGKENVFLIRYEDLVDNYSKVLKDLRKQFSLKKKGDDFYDIEGIVAPFYGEVRVQFDKDYYQNRQYMESINSELHQCINEVIDWKLIQQFGYQKINNRIKELV